MLGDPLFDTDLNAILIIHGTFTATATATIQIFAINLRLPVFTTVQNMHLLNMKPQREIKLPSSNEYLTDSCRT